MRAWLHRYGWELRNNNNVRLLTLWVVTGLWLIAHLMIFGLFPKTAATPTSGLRQKFNNYYLHGKWATDAELVGKAFGTWHWILAVLLALIILIWIFTRLRDEVWATWIALAAFIGLIVVAWTGGLFSGMPEGMRWISSRILIVLLIASVVYFPIAMRDEVGAIWRAAARRYQRKMGGTTDLDDPIVVTPKGSRSAKPVGLNWKQYASIEFIMSFLAELFTEIVTKGILRRV